MQEHLEAILFGVMRSRGYDDTYVQRYKMVTNFFQQRRPLIILICGVPCTGVQTAGQLGPVSSMACKQQRLCDCRCVNLCKLAA